MGEEKVISCRTGAPSGTEREYTSVVFLARMLRPNKRKLDISVSLLRSPYTSNATTRQQNTARPSSRSDVRPTSTLGSGDNASRSISQCFGELRSVSERSVSFRSVSERFVAFRSVSRHCGAFCIVSERCGALREVVYLRVKDDG